MNKYAISVYDTRYNEWNTTTTDNLGYAKDTVQYALDRITNPRLHIVLLSEEKNSHQGYATEYTANELLGLKD